MSNYQAYPPIIEVPIFNSLLFRFYDQAATIADLMKYLPLTGGSIAGNLFVNGLLSVNSNSLLIGSTIVSSTAAELNYLSGVTLGTITASKALTADANGTITFLNSIDSILIQNTNSTQRANIKFTNDVNTSLEVGVRGSSSSSNANKAYLYYNNAYCLTVDTNNNIAIKSTTTSSSTITGALTVAGGVGVLDNVNIGGNLYVGGVQIMPFNPASILNLTNTTDATSYTTGALITAGGLGVAKKTYLNSNLFVNSTVQITNANTPSSGVGLEFNYNTGTSTANIYSYDRSASQYKLLNLNDFLTIDKAGSNMRINTSSTMGVINVGTNGSNNLVRFYNNSSSNYSAAFGYSSNCFTITTEDFVAPNTNQSFLTATGYLSLGKWNGIPRYPLDFGYNAAGNVMIALYAPVSGNVFGLGASGGNLLFHSDAGFKFYQGTNQSGTLGTNTVSISSVGSITSNANFVGKGVFVNSFSGDSVSGQGCKVHYTSNLGGSGIPGGQIFSYDYSAGNYLTTQLGSNCYFTINGSSTGLSINASSVSWKAPLAVYGTENFTKFSGNFGYLTSTGAGNASGGFTNRPFSIWTAGAMLCETGEINVMSDTRIKKNINNIDNDIVTRFLNIDAIQFQYKRQKEDDNSLYYSFRAQDFIKYKIPHIVDVTTLNEEVDIEDEDIECYDGDIYHLPKDLKLMLNNNALIPLLHTLIKRNHNRLLEVEKKLEDITKQLSNMSTVDVKVNNDLSGLHDLLKDLKLKN